MPGFSVGKAEKKLGICASSTCSLDFDQVKVQSFLIQFTSCYNVLLSHIPSVLLPHNTCLHSWIKHCVVVHYLLAIFYRVWSFIMLPSWLCHCWKLPWWKSLLKLLSFWCRQLTSSEAGLMSLLWYCSMSSIEIATLFSCHRNCFELALHFCKLSSHSIFGY